MWLNRCTQILHTAWKGQVLLGPSISRRYPQSRYAADSRVWMTLWLNRPSRTCSSYRTRNCLSRSKRACGRNSGRACTFRKRRWHDRNCLLQHDLPASITPSTTCTAQPEYVAPGSNACFCACRPGNRHQDPPVPVRVLVDEFVCCPFRRIPFHAWMTRSAG